MGWVTALLAGASLGLQVATAKKNKKLMQEAEYKKLKETAKNSLKDNVFIPEKLKKTKAIIEEEMLSIIKNQKQIKLLKKLN